MKKTTLALLMALPFTSVAANWEVKPIVTTIEDRQVPVAIMLYTNSTMTQGQDSTPLQMRMVCNINKDKIVGFVWNNSPNTKVINSSITVDGRALKNSIKWDKSGDLFFRQAADSSNLIASLRKGKDMQFKFEHNGQFWSTEIDLTGFSKAHTAFNTACGF